MAVHSAAPGETRTGAARLRADDLALLDRLVQVAVTGLPRMYRPDRDIFAFTRAFTRPAASVPAPRPGGAPPTGSVPPTGGTASAGGTAPGAGAGPDGGAASGGGAGGPAGGWRGELRGESLRYSAIVALGAHWLAEPVRTAALAGRSPDAAVATLIEQAESSTNLGDVALVCWAAAQSSHPGLTRALRRLRALDDPARPSYVVELAWVVSALAAARHRLGSDVGEQLTSARDRLLAARAPESPLFPHTTGPGLVKGYRSHVACFADQVYPIQALARLHASGDDPAALRAADACAARIVELQGPAGQWWWHYDSRTGRLIEGYPVYTVHQHAMAPMALFDLREAGGADHSAAIRSGLRWIERPAELGAAAEPMVIDDEGVTWRKVYRGDPHKVVRGLHTVTTRLVPGLRLPGPGLVYRPTAVDRECRPYEFGWLFFAWYARLP